MEKEKKIDSKTVKIIAVVLVFIVIIGIAGFTIKGKNSEKSIFGSVIDNLFNKNNLVNENKLSSELINVLENNIPHRYYNVYKNLEDELSNISLTNIYGEVVTRLNFKPTTEKYYYSYGNYYLENCEIASMDEFENSIQEMYNLNFDSDQIKNNVIGYYDGNAYYYINDTIIKIKTKGSNDIESNILNNVVNHELIDDELIITERIALYNTLSYYDSYNFTNENKYVLTNVYDQKYYFSTKQELEQYFKDNIKDFPIYKSTFKKIDNNYYWNSTKKVKDSSNNKNPLWIYPANYSTNNLVPNYNNGSNYYLSDIKLPYINIDSEDAKKTNKEISLLYEETLNDYKKYATDSLPWFITTDYEYYSFDKIGSVIVTSSSGGTDMVSPYYLTYNFNLDNGKLLTYQEVYNLLGFSSNEIEKKVKDKITLIMKDKFKDMKLGDTNFETYNNESISNYQSSVNNNSIKFFVDSDKKLNIVVTLSIPAGTREFDTIIKII